MVINRLKNWYGKYERPISSLSLIGGFVFDALTLRRVDFMLVKLEETQATAAQNV